MGIYDDRFLPGLTRLVDEIHRAGAKASIQLGQHLTRDLADLDDDSLKGVHVKISGCPNGCGQHHIANIGFYGASIKVGEHTIPAYIPHIGGSYEGGEVRYGQRLKARLPAKRVPDAVERWVRYYESERAEGEEFNAFADRVGAKEFEARVKDLAMPVEFSLENMNFFVDWARSGPFEVIRGEGECAV